MKNYSNFIKEQFDYTDKKNINLIIKKSIETENINALTALKEKLPEYINDYFLLYKPSTIMNIMREFKIKNESITKVYDFFRSFYKKEIEKKYKRSNGYNDLTFYTYNDKIIAEYDRGALPNRDWSGEFNTRDNFTYNYRIFESVFETLKNELGHKKFIEIYGKHLYYAYKYEPFIKKLSEEFLHITITRMIPTKGSRTIKELFWEKIQSHLV